MSSNTNTTAPIPTPTAFINPAQKLGPFPSVRRVVTGHSAEGKPTVIRDEVQQPFFWNPKVLSPVSDFYRTSEHPANLDCEVKTSEWVDEIKENPEVISANGSTFRVIDMPPGLFVPMHRTISVDYGIMAKGTLTLVLDDGKKCLLNEGDVMIQRGTMHGWKNETDEWVRMYCVSLASKPVEVNGELLPQVLPGPRKL